MAKWLTDWEPIKLERLVKAARVWQRTPSGCKADADLLVAIDALDDKPEAYEPDPAECAFNPVADYQQLKARVDNLEPYARDILSGLSCRSDGIDERIEKLEAERLTSDEFNAATANQLQGALRDIHKLEALLKPVVPKWPPRKFPDDDTAEVEAVVEAAPEACKLFTCHRSEYMPPLVKWMDAVDALIAKRKEGTEK